MLGILYLSFAWWVGYLIIKKFLPQLFNLHTSVSLDGNPGPLPNWLVTLPASFLVGTLFTTWSTYLTSLLFYRAKSPLLCGNIISVLVIFLISIFLSYKKAGAGLNAKNQLSIKTRLLTFLKEDRFEILFAIALVSIYSFLMFYTFSFKNGEMIVGDMVWGDLGAHLSMIRSFSFGSNFPTQYPYFADGHIRYHFLFHFLVGNLEFLGLRIDLALNLSCIISATAFLMLLYSLAVLTMGRKTIGAIAVFLFFFRSSPAIFKFIANVEKTNDILPKILTNDRIIGYTPFENWGIYTQGVYQNQRHLPYSIGILLLIIILTLPLFKKMLSALKPVTTEKITSKDWWREFLTAMDAWLPEGGAARPIIVGVILGLTVFWNGMAVVSALAVLFCFAVFSKHRLEYLYIALITGVLTWIQSVLFAGPGNALVHPQLVFGYIEHQSSLPGIVKYYFDVFGVLPLIVFGSLILAPKGGRWLILAFSAPLILINFVQLTKYDVTEHKIILISILLLNIIVANFLYRLFTLNLKNVILSGITRITVVILFLLLTITGVVDWIALANMNKAHWGFKINDPVVVWIRKHTDPRTVFLTKMDVYLPPLLAGRMTYCGYPGYGDSAGYDVQSRAEILKKIYSGNDALEVMQLLQKTHIDYILVDEVIRNSPEYQFNETLFHDNFQLVYQGGDPVVQIYRPRIISQM